MWGTRIATASVRTGFAMTPLTRGAVCGPMWGAAPTERLLMVPGAGGVEPRPYGEVTRGAAGKTNPSVTASPCQPPLGKGAYKDGGRGLPRALCALAMTGGFGNKKGMPVRASLLRFYAGAIALARVCAYSISRRFDCLASWVTLGRISSRTPLSYLALMLAVSMPATLKLRL